MARARLLKPGFFANEKLAEVGPWGRLLFAGLWTLADREGRQADRPLFIKGQLFPYDKVPVDKLLNDLAERGFIQRYVVDGDAYILITKWHGNQRPHHNEPDSTIPPPSGLTTSDIVARASEIVGRNPPEAEAVTKAGAKAETEAVAVGPPDQPAKAFIKHEFETRIGFVPPSFQDEFNSYVRFVPEDWFIKAIEVTANEADQPCWAFCKKVIDGAMSRNQPPGSSRGAAVPTSIAEELKRRRR